jgi:hypothetical protein
MVPNVSNKTALIIISLNHQVSGGGLLRRSN